MSAIPTNRARALLLAAKLARKGHVQSARTLVKRNAGNGVVVVEVVRPDARSAR